MILSMLKSFGRSIWHFFVRPAPTSVALMVGSMPDAANDDHAQLLRRAMRAASQPEDMAPAFETTVAEPRLTIVPPALPETAAAAGFEKAESAQQAEEFEDDPEGGINEEADGAALALTGEEGAAAEAEEMDLAEAAAPIEAVPAPEEERLDAASDDEALDEAGMVAPTDDGLTAVAAEPPESGELDVEDVGDADEDDSETVAAVADAYDDGVPDEPVDIAKKVAQAPYVAALAELVTVVSGLRTEDRASADEVAATDEPTQEDEAPQEAIAADEDAGEAGPMNEPIAAASNEEPAGTEDVVETEEAEVEAAMAAIAEEPVEEEAPAKKPRKKRASSPSKKKSSTKAASRKSKAKAKDDVPAEPVPEDDVWVSDAVVWSLSGEWVDGAWHAPEDLDCPQRLEELRELAAEGRLTIWGRSDDAAVWQPIEAAYWKSGTVEPASLAEGRENVVAEPKSAGKAKSKRKSARKYSALKVSKSQIEEIWHPGAMH